ncbi:MAG: hypothetical protein AAFO95_08015 [Cyanobacteria bacterium J06600_6]
MDTIDYQSPNTFLFLQHQISVNDANSIIYEWLKEHPLESRATLSKLLESHKVIVKQNKLFDLPRLSLTEATQLVREIQMSGKLEIADRQYQLTKYPQCFIGSELVDWLIENKDVIELEAIAIGQNLLEHNLIAHVRKQHDFKNEFLFYHFQDLSSSQGHGTKLSLAEARQIAQELRSDPQLKIKDRRYRLTSYPECFVGSDLVDCLIKNKNITADEAIAIGQSLLEHNLIAHVCNDHDFENGFLFYRFQDD